MNYQQLPEDFLTKSTVILTEITDTLAQLPKVSGTNFNPDTTALVIIDLVNGFVRQGPLQSPRVHGLIEEISTLVSKFQIAGFPVIAFADCHTENSLEFINFPPHCLKGTTECDLVEELKLGNNDTLINKNSTNGFLEPAFQSWLKAHPLVNNFIVVGDCTDICVEQFTKTLKAYFNMLDQGSRVIVPVNAVETFDLGNHYAELMNVMALYSMMGAGIELVASVE